MRSPRRPLLLLLLVLAAAVLAACGSGGGERKVLQPRSHVVIVVMENLAFTDVIGSRAMPYVNSLRRRAAVPETMFGVAHPSLTDYLALISGNIQGVKQNCTSCHFGSRTLPDQLEQAGYTWKGYMQSMPSPCFKGASYGRVAASDPRLDAHYAFLPGFRDLYAKKHNPFMYFDQIADNPRRCANVVPLTRLDADLRTGRLADYSMISPDRCHDTHDCRLSVGDGFLREWVPKILPRLGPHGFLMITWDEGRDTSTAGCCGVANGGRIATFLLGPDVIPRAKGTGAYTHYSTLRTIEDAFDLPHLGHAADAQIEPLDALFELPPRYPKAADLVRG